MPEKIKILPESIVNKIAAGQVIRRPASVVKELVENSIDALASEITISITDAGRTAIQVIDNGIGMSPTDARLAFEHHATSKISSLDDLFHITTKGFRGEALASIAAVAQVELKTRREKDKIGTKIIIHGGKFISQEPIQCPKGANFLVKNLFFNVPARRKFLKSDTTELKHIFNEFYRLAIPHPKIAFTLYNNKQLIYKLQPASLKERILTLFDKSLNKYLIPIQKDAGFVKIFGFISSPELTRKRYAEQYFFVNSRFFKNTYLHRAIIKAYEKLLPQDAKPVYFVFFEIDPARIDVNIDPEKTEVNFQDSEAIYQLLFTSVRQALAQYGIFPSIDFEASEFIQLEQQENPSQSITLTSSIQNQQTSSNTSPKLFNNPKFHSSAEKNWEKLLENLPDKETVFSPNFLNFKNKYILTPLASGLAIISQQRAYQTVLYYEYLERLNNSQIHSQQTLYPLTININPQQYIIIKEFQNALENIGYKFEEITQNNLIISSIPAFFSPSEAQTFLQELINNPDLTQQNIQQNILETLAINIATVKAKNFNYKLSEAEMESLVNKLFSSPSPNYSPLGKKNFFILKTNEIEKFFE